MFGGFRVIRNRRVAMKNKAVLAALYALTALAFWSYFDSLYGAGPITHHLSIIYAAIAGGIMFAAAFVVSFLSLRLGVFCGLTASGLSWPWFAVEGLTFPWRHVFQVLPHGFWADTLGSLFMLAISSAYTLAHLRNRAEWASQNCPSRKPGETVRPRGTA
jgi:hypothetical protein